MSTNTNGTSIASSNSFVSDIWTYASNGASSFVESIKSTVSSVRSRVESWMSKVKHWFVYVQPSKTRVKKEEEDAKRKETKAVVNEMLEDEKEARLDLEKETEQYEAEVKRLAALKEAAQANAAKQEELNKVIVSSGESATAPVVEVIPVSAGK